MSKQVEIKGLAEVKAKLRKIIDKTPARARSALNRAAEKIMTDSKEHYVPVAPDGGTLRSSGHVTMTPGRLQAELSYGGPAAAYALAVHEHPSEASPPSWKGKTINWNVAGTGEKYLEKPVMAAIPTLAKDIAEDLDLESMLV